MSVRLIDSCRRPALRRSAAKVGVLQAEEAGRETVTLAVAVIEPSFTLTVPGRSCRGPRR